MNKHGRLYRRLLAAVALLLPLGTGWFIWFLCYAPLPPSLEALQARRLTALFLDTHERLIAEIPGTEARSHRPVPLEQMGPWLPAVTVTLEDRRFHRHWGVDFRAKARALLHWRGGGSTITEQLVKLATGRRGRSPIAKAVEALRALQLERRWTKPQILEAYLNGIPYGNRLIGAEAAAQAYFSKPAATLTEPEAIFLAGLPRSPVRLNPWRHPGVATAQFKRSAAALASGTGTVRELAVPVVERHLPGNLAPDFLQALRDASGTSDDLTGVIRTTLDLDLQRNAREWVRAHLEELGRFDITQASLVIVENETGAVRALVGSRPFAGQDQAGGINGALAFRNCGSTLKPFVYLTGIDQKVFTAATLLPDTADAVRERYPDYDPHNFALNHFGPVRVREALASSLNVPAVVALSRIGARHAYDAIEGWGVRFDRPMKELGAGFVLGNAGVRLVDLTAAFSGLARGGLVCPPRFREDSPTVFRRAASPGAVAIIVDILCDNRARFRAFGANSPLSTPVRVGAKTGTSAGFRDAWAVGFTREHTVGVWVGNFDGRPMNRAASVIAAAPLWRRAIDDLLEHDRPVPDPTLPRTPVCALTGLRPNPRSPGVIGELFLPGTEPVESADAWFAEDGHPLLPLEYAGWCASGENALRATVRVDPAKLAILSPREKAVFSISRDLPPAQQQLEMRVNIPEGTVWKLNGASLPSPRDGRLLWTLQPGEWTLEVSNAATRQERHFRVTRTTLE